MNADGSDLRQLTTMGQCYDAHFSPDGRTIVFSHDGDIWKMNSDGSGQTNLTNSREQVEGFPVVSPDGSRIAYLFAWQGGFELYSMALDGSDRRAITSRQFDLMPNWAPNGQKVTFSSARSGSFNIWTVNPDGSGLTQVTKFGPERIAFSPVFSPDGQQVAFSTIAAGTSWEIWAANLDGSNVRKVVGAIGSDRNNSALIAAWRGDKLLLRGYEGNWDPYFVSQSGGAPTRVVVSDKDDKVSDWLP